MRIDRAVMVSAYALGACASQSSEVARRLADTTGRRDSIAAVVAASLTEAQVIGLLDQVHASDSALGTLGAVQGGTLEIKDFGRMIAREHHALRRDAERLARGLRLAPQAPPAPDQAPAVFRQNLSTARRGESWDRAYVEYAIAVHEAAMENTARALAATNSPTTREYIRRTVPILQKHLDKARALQEARAKASRATAATTR